jgi:hypothetical protein
MIPTEPTPTADATSPRVLTWLQADRLRPHDVFERWRNHRSATLKLDEPEHHLEELALMTVAAEWLTRWQPITVHRAILAGASSAQVSAAAGMSIRDVYERWHNWADVQRHFMIGGQPGVTEEAYATVLASFAAAFQGPLKSYAT